jgi:hypothetical protein
VSTKDAIDAVWALLALILVAATVAAYLSKRRFPTLGALTRKVTSKAPGRALLMLGWMWLGWHLFAR